MNTTLMQRRKFLSIQKRLHRRLTIGFTAIADFRSFIGQEYLAGIAKAAADYDINLINMTEAVKYSFLDDIDFLQHYLKKFRFMKKPYIDGLVTWASSMCPYMNNTSIEKKFKELQPLPMVDIGYMTIDDVPSIRINNETSLSILLDHLVNVHHYTKFAYIGSENSNPHMKRLEFYRKSLAKHGLSEIEGSTFLIPSMDRKDICDSIQDILNKFDLHDKKEIDCIITPSDIIAATVVDKLAEENISVPEDVAVTGFNNQYDGIIAQIPITTINLEYFQRGYAAVELLIDRIMNPKEKFETRHISTSLVVRQSCGCFEKEVVEAGISTSETFCNALEKIESESDIRELLLKEITMIFPHQSQEDISSLIEAIFHDIYEYNEKTDENSFLLSWFRKQLQYQKFNKQHKQTEKSLSEISQLRRILVPLVHDDEKRLIQVESIINQLLVLISVESDYSSLAERENTYMFNNLSNIAMQFASADNSVKLRNVLKYQLVELKITGIMLVLQDRISPDIGLTTLQFIDPEPEKIIQNELPLRIPSGAFIPERFFPTSRRYSMTLEILNWGNNYMGYALFEMTKSNVAICDAVKTLLCHALYGIFARTSNTNNNYSLIAKPSNTYIMEDPEIADNQTSNGKLYNSEAQKIIDYLHNHIDEKTNLDKMSKELAISKSWLIHKTKELTGYTVQTLHEQMKIQKAKKLMSMGTLQLNEIADRLGFQNQNYFSVVFKKNTGFSPLHYLKNKDIK